LKQEGNADGQQIWPEHVVLYNVTYTVIYCYTMSCKVFLFWTKWHTNTIWCLVKKKTKQTPL